nr:hypothetical protein [uncultured Pedobacter sp.]
MSFTKKGGAFELLAKDFLERILTELKYDIVRSRGQNSGTQDGYDNLVVVVDHNFKRRLIYVECKDYSTKLGFADAMEKIPHIISTHGKIDLLLFISPLMDFSNPNEDTKLEGFYQILADRCPVEFLTPNAFVREYFSLYPDLYQQLYDEPAVEPDSYEREKYLNKFEKLIFSDNRLKKIIINDSNRKEYIGKLDKNEYHIDRTVRYQFERSPFDWEENEQSLSTEEAISRSKWGVVLLGNPGYGKTSELQQLAVRLWGQGEGRAWIPKYENLRDFHSGTLIEEFLPEDFRHIGALLLILDGIDEVYDITDFTNKLRRFSSEHHKLLEDGSLKILISCRTNIYLKYIKSIQGMDAVFLNGVTEGGAIRFLHRRFNIDPLNRKEFDFWHYRDILENPFYLVLIGLSFADDKKIYLSRAKLIEAYLARRLEDDFNEKNRNDPTFNKEEQLQVATRMAVAMEAMQRSELKENEIRTFLKPGDNFSKNPFLEQNPSCTWSFEHKNIQEYLTASFLSRLAFREVIDFINIGEGFNRVHPSWYNVVAFLLNIGFDKAEYLLLVNWLITNDIELLFGAEPDFVQDQTKDKAFQAFFQSRVLDQALWVENTTVLAEFGNTSANVEYLLGILKNSSLNLRVRISASSLLRDMGKIRSYHSQIEEVVLQVVGEFKGNSHDFVYLMENVLKLMLELPDPFLAPLLKSVIAELREFDQREVVRSLLNGITGENLYLHIDYILEILGKAIKEKPWNYSSKYGTILSTKEKIFEIFCQVKDPVLLLQIFGFLIERHNNYELKEKLITSFLIRLKPIFANNVVLIGRELVEILTEAVSRGKIRHFEDDLLIELVKECKLERQVYKRLVPHALAHPHVVYFLAEMPSAEAFDMILEAFRQGLLNDRFINSYRKIIANHEDIDHAIAFEHRVEAESGHKFSDHINKAKRKETVRWHKNREQRDFDVMFDITALLSQMRRIYEFLGVSRLSQQKMDTFSKSYYDDNALQKEINPYAKDLLGELISKKYNGKKMLPLNDLEGAFGTCELARMENIASVLPVKDRVNKVVRLEQREVILNWCLSNQQLVLDHYGENAGTNNKSHDLAIGLLFKFQRYFKFKELEQKVLLELIWEGIDHEKLNLDYLEGVIPNEIINGHLFSLLEGKNLNLMGRFMLLEYLKSNGQTFNISEVTLKEQVIDELNYGNSYFPKQTVKLFFKDDVVFLKQLLELFAFDSRHKYFIPFVLDLLKELDGVDDVNRFISSNYDKVIASKIMNEKELFSLMVKNNNPLAFKKLGQMMKQPYHGEAVVSGYDGSWKGYTNKDSIDDVLAIVEIGQSGVTSPSLFDDTSSFIRMATETLLSIAKAHDAQTCLEIMEKFSAKNFIMATDNDVYFLNGFKNDLDESYCNHISKPLPLSATVGLLEKHRFNLI